MNKFFDKHGDYFYVVFRVIVGFVFLLHGVAKVGNAELLSLMWFAMLIEIVAGAFVILGLFTRISAVVAALEMAYAFLFVHVASGGWNPLSNNCSILLHSLLLLHLAHGVAQLIAVYEEDKPTLFFNRFLMFFSLFAVR